MSNILVEIETFCAANGLSESQFGVLALNDKNIIPDLRKGRDIRLSTAERLRAKMAAYHSSKDQAA